VPRRAGKPTGLRKWLYRLTALTLVPCVLLGLFELGLRLGGYGHRTSYFVRRDAAGRRGAVYGDNPSFGARFFPPGLLQKPRATVVPVKKATGTYRIFVFGESAAMGFPDPAYSSARILEAMLRDAYPDRRFEVVNTAMAAINSHAVLPIARECAGLQPDLFVVDMGNNEVVGMFGAAGVMGAPAQRLSLIRANLAVKTLRTGQLLGSLFERGGAGNSPAADGLALFATSQVSADDRRLEATYHHFRQNLSDICEAGTDAGAAVLVCTVPGNLKDCPPFQSVHAAELSADQAAVWDTAYEAGIRHEDAGRYAEALVHYEQAAGIDERFAELPFRQARCLLALGQTEKARQKYLRARDLDALRLRTDTTINATIRDVVAGFAVPQVHLVDTEQAMAAASACGIPGEDLFFEHVHMNFKGNHTFASAVFRAIAKLLPPPPGAGVTDAPQPLTEAQCAQRLAYGSWAQFKAESLIAPMLHQPPFSGQLGNAQRRLRWDARLADYQKHFDANKARQELDACEQALQAAPDDWILREKYADLLVESGMPHVAVVQYELVARQVPHHYVLLGNLGSARMALGEFASAQASFEAALAVDPDYTSAHYDLAMALAAQGRVEEAIGRFEAHARRETNRSEALAELARFLLLQDRPTQAGERLREALAINPEAPAAHLAMGDLLARQGANDEAIAHYEAAARFRPRYLPQVTKLVAGLRKSP
jgi:tetratricopeptide (TPR) repeat protein